MVLLLIFHPATDNVPNKDASEAAKEAETQLLCAVHGSMPRCHTATLWFHQTWLDNLTEWRFRSQEGTSPFSLSSMFQPAMLPKVDKATILLRKDQAPEEAPKEEAPKETVEDSRPG